MQPSELYTKSDTQKYAATDHCDIPVRAIRLNPIQDSGIFRILDRHGIHNKTAKTAIQHVECRGERKQAYRFSKRRSC